MIIRGGWYCGMEVPPKMPNFVLEEHMAKQLEVIVSNPYMTCQRLISLQKCWCLQCLNLGIVIFENEPCNILWYLLYLTISVLLSQRKQFIRVNRMLYIAHAFIRLPVSFVPPHRKRFIGLDRMSWIAHATKIWTVLDASSIANVLHLFWQFFTPPFAFIASHIVSLKGLWS